MAQTPLEQALDRAERALTRIRHSARRPATPAAAAPIIRDDKLRAEVAAAIADLDRILGDAGGRG